MPHSIYLTVNHNPRGGTVDLDERDGYYALPLHEYGARQLRRVAVQAVLAADSGAKVTLRLRHEHKGADPSQVFPGGRLGAYNALGWLDAVIKRWDASLLLRVAERDQWAGLRDDPTVG